MSEEILSSCVPVNIVARLDEIAQERGVHRNELVRGLLALFTGVNLQDAGKAGFVEMPPGRKSKSKMRWTDGRGKEQTREINLVIHVQDFIETPGYPLLVLAANTHLSITDYLAWLELKGFERGRSWATRRRGLFQRPGGDSRFMRPSPDGKDARAKEIMAQLPTASLRYLSRVLKANGIERGKDWCRFNRAAAK
jgi:hypothetical protein